MALARIGADDETRPADLAQGRVGSHGESLAMYVIVNHSIRNPEGFWGALRAAGAPPAGTKVHHLLPSADGASAVCLWEADSVDTVRRLVDATVGASSTNAFFEVDAAHAMGLPK